MLVSGDDGIAYTVTIHRKIYDACSRITTFSSYIPLLTYIIYWLPHPCYFPS
ncbi:hypothetical protein Hanom_Chr06g00563941 [Helianthus anomalus]